MSGVSAMSGAIELWNSGGKDCKRLAAMAKTILRAEKMCLSLRLTHHTSHVVIALHS